MMAADQNNDALLLLPDYSDDPSNILVSFPEIKRQTTQALYQQITASSDNNIDDDNDKIGYRAVDKSPKGSVDEKIQPLVDLINHHPSFSTLSSCSGRIALFEPWGTTSNSETAEEGQNTTTASNTSNDNVLQLPENRAVQGTPESGKGRGGWLFVSHDIIEAKTLQEIFQINADVRSEQYSVRDTTICNSIEQALVFKVEPMLLHVAAATLDRGKQLLNLALNLGFRESGIVLPNKRNHHRVTVAIRGVSLALTVPLAFQGPLRPTPEYLQALVDQANHRLKLNQNKIDKLYEAVRKSIFLESEGGDASCATAIQCNPLPDLNFWGHAAVAVRPIHDKSAEDNSNVDILVFGGYGQGPELEIARASKSCQRSGEIFCLQRRAGHWADYWRRIKQIEVLKNEEMEELCFSGLNIAVKPTTFTPREGAAACILDMASTKVDRDTIIAIWGGRKGPNNALDDLLLYKYPAQQDCFWKPFEVRGEKPSPRWGHSMTALNYKSSDQGTKRLALLVGGRNERTALNSVHLLSLIQENDNIVDGSAHFLWETIQFVSSTQPLSLPFYHSTVISNEEDDSINIFIFGGSTDPVNLLDSFSPATANDAFPVSFSLSLNSEQRQLATPNSIKAAPSLQANNFAGAATLISQPSKGAIGSTSRYLILFSGGIPQQCPTEAKKGSNPKSVLQLVELSCQKKDQNSEWSLNAVEFDIVHANAAPDQTVMVHHRAIAVPSSNDMAVDTGADADVLLLGGGVMGFAFGPCFSRYGC